MLIVIEETRKEISEIFGTLKLAPSAEKMEYLTADLLMLLKKQILLLIEKFYRSWPKITPKHSNV